jgi:asparagine synthase (glutamine-hydrolysing)
MLPHSLTAGAGRLLSRFLSRRNLKAIEGLGIRDESVRHTFWQTIVPDLWRRRLLASAGRQSDPVAILREITDELGNADSLEKLFYFDLRSWLVEDLLMKKDKMGMSASIEARVPYLDQDVVAFAAALPATLKIHGLKRKYVFRRLVTDYLPQEILDRPKVGFAVPLADWFRGELKEFLHRNLIEPGGFLDEHLDRPAREAMFVAHQNGEDLSLSLYSLLVLELWGRLFCRGESTEEVSGVLQASLR